VGLGVAKVDHPNMFCCPLGKKQFADGQESFSGRKVDPDRERREQSASLSRLCVCTRINKLPLRC
jgi:hypothetical protein